ncbi:MAG: hypothetical protein R6V50_02410 [Thermoplasmatota archaeon]
MVMRTCGVCKTEIDLNEHQAGLVFEDKIFLCSLCCEHSSDEEISEWSKSIMKEPGKGMPIALWLIHEQNKDKPLLSRVKS